MIKYQIGYGLKILFIGINPHPGSDKRGVPFSNNKMFWYLLHGAGILKEPRELLKDEKYLKHLYLYEFKKIYGFGLINMVDRPSRTASDLKKIEAVPGRKRLYTIIKRYKPKIVCFVGKITYSLFIDQKEVEYGWQPDIDDSKIYVMHTPLHGPASVRIKDLKKVYKAASLPKVNT